MSDKCSCGATRVPNTGWCFTCNPEFKRALELNDQVSFAKKTIPDGAGSGADVKLEDVRRATQMLERERDQLRARVIELEKAIVACAEPMMVLARHAPINLRDEVKQIADTLRATTLTPFQRT